MSHTSLVDSTVRYVQEELRHAEGGHDWFHTERVWKNAQLIARGEPVDTLVVELAALLHDIADAKFYGGDEEIGPAKATRFLQAQHAPEAITQHVALIVRHVSFKGGNSTSAWSSPELHVVRDADRLDALGAIGIARTFNYGGFRGRALYDPSIPPVTDMTVEQYRASTAPTINHFYEKLLLLKDRMHTETARRIAEERHRFMEQFLAQFFSEWEGRS